MSKFVVVDNNKVVMVADGKKFGDGRNCISIPDDCPIIQGQDIREFDKNWNIKPLADRVAEGFVKIDKFFEVSGETIKPKSIIKLIKEGIEEIPAGYKLVPEGETPDGFDPIDGFALVPLTTYELMANGVIDKPKGHKLIKDSSVFGGYRLEQMTQKERIEAGEITEEDILKIEKENRILELKKYLDETDWYIIRKMERNIDIPKEVSNKRKECLKEIESLER